MTKAAKEFNQKYNLNISDKYFERVDHNNYDSQDLVGKIKKNWKESFKRFFMSPVYSISLIIFIILIIVAITVKYTSPFSSEKPILNSDVINPSKIKNLHGSNEIITSTLSSAELDRLKLNNISYKILLNYGDSYMIEYNPWDYVNKIAEKNNLPKMSSVMGTNSIGVDFWTRTWVGTLNSLGLALLVAFITTFIGASIGSWIGMYPGTIYDIILMKIIALYNAIPGVVWYAIILSFMSPSQNALFVVLVATGWQRGLGISRIYMWKVTNSGFMESANTMGVSKFKRIFKHAIPHYLGILAYGFVGSVPGIIQSIAVLAFLGFQLNPFAADLGNTLNQLIVISNDFANNTLKIFLPTFIIFIISMSLHFCAVGINDALDPRYRKKGK
ncbi:MAG: ABC transporter permease [Mycoplasmatales bacterium]|nr:ABC transporter permease [Mycoplasmatales bacterium]